MSFSRGGLFSGRGRPFGFKARLGAKRSAEPAYDAAALALFARFTGAPSIDRKIAINTLIVALKGAGLWSKLDVLYLTAAHDAQAAQRNWRADSFNLTPANSPVFTVDRGYKGDGSTSYLTTGFNPATAGGVFAQDSAHIGVYINTDDVGSGGIIGNTNGAIIPRNGTSLTTRLNNTTGISGTLNPVTAIGHSVVSRTGATAASAYKDAVELSTSNAVSIALVSEQMDICRRRQTSSSYQPARVAAAHWGAGLTAGEAATLRGHLLSFLTAIGAT